MSEGVYLPTPSAAPTAVPGRPAAQTPSYRRVRSGGGTKPAEPNRYSLADLSTLVTSKILQSRLAPRLGEVSHE
ncbi:hypothetical protein ACWDYH_28600 [Nocardia goodfellowii]